MPSAHRAARRAQLGVGAGALVPVPVVQLGLGHLGVDEDHGPLDRRDRCGPEPGIAIDERPDQIRDERSFPAFVLRAEHHARIDRQPALNAPPGEATSAVRRLLCPGSPRIATVHLF